MVAAYIPTSCSKQLWVSVISQSLVLVDSGDCLIIETHNCFEQLAVHKQLLPFTPFAEVGDVCQHAYNNFWEVLQWAYGNKMDSC